ncbi:sensor histidine kinase [Acidicapsa ligni]|uniref:sensor histidine kinase n=1 Tax=Acidicapsa ligni TaxID=542300 RepID=UPI0021E0F87B|nr:ATP-binding protein [Acidicapsa ligni]
MREILADSLKQSDALIEEAQRNMIALGLPGLDDNLPGAVAVAGRTLKDGGKSKYSVIVHGDMRHLRPMVRDDVYGIAREALSNAFRHAGANEIEAEFFYERNEMRVYVRDDGCGISSTALWGPNCQRHRGILEMRRKARRSGAALEIRSGRNAGAEIEIRLPSALAYEVD